MYQAPEEIFFYVTLTAATFGGFVVAQLVKKFSVLVKPKGLFFISSNPSQLNQFNTCNSVKFFFFFEPFPLQFCVHILSSLCVIPFPAISSSFLIKYLELSCS
jgi:hypothetical protein